MYTMELTVPEHQCDTRCRMKLGYVLRNLQEVATNHFSLVNDLHDKLAWKVHFFIASMHLRVAQLPKMGQPVVLRTYFSGPKGVFLVRNTEILDADERPLVQCSCNWFLVDAASRGVVKPKDSPYLLPQEPHDFPITSPRRIRVEQPLELTDRRRVHYSQLDSNGHLNNAVYGDLIQDLLWERLDERPLADLEIVYHHEAKLGQVIELFTATGTDSSDIVGRVGQTDCFTARVTLRQ